MRQQLRLLVPALIATLGAVGVARAGSASFVPGDVVIGSIDLAADEDASTFQGLTTDKLKLRIAVSAGLEVRVAVRDAQGAEVAGFDVKGGKKGKKVKKKLKLTSTGVHTLVVTGLGDSTGDYEIKTKRKASTLARSKIHFAVEAIPELSYAEVLLAGYPGTLFSANVIPNAALTPNDLNLSFFGPTNQAINTNSKESKSELGAHLTNFSLLQLGQHRLRIGGVGVPGGKVDVTIILIHPAPAEAPVTID